jgi:hypothetical protein
LCGAKAGAKGQKTVLVKAEFLDAAFFWHRVEGVRKGDALSGSFADATGLHSGETGCGDEFRSGSHRDRRHSGIEKNFGPVKKGLEHAGFIKKKERKYRHQQRH